MMGAMGQQMRFAAAACAHQLGATRRSAAEPSPAEPSRAQPKPAQLSSDAGLRGPISFRFPFRAIPLRGRGADHMSRAVCLPPGRPRDADAKPAAAAAGRGMWFAACEQVLGDIVSCEQQEAGAPCSLTSAGGDGAAT